MPCHGELIFDGYESFAIIGPVQNVTGEACMVSDTEDRACQLLIGSAFQGYAMRITYRK
jgi:hypothetical protein